MTDGDGVSPGEDGSTGGAMTGTWAGRWIRQYQLLEPLGGSGRVYRARHRDLRIDRAFMVVPETLRRTPEERERLLREAERGAQLRHPNMVPVHEVFEEDGLLCVVMELVESWTLAERIRQDGPLPAAEAGRVALQVGAALDHAHAMGLAHGDLRAGSVLLRLPDQTPLLTGFGLRPADPKDDVRALAALCAEMVTGQAGDQRRQPETAGELAKEFAGVLTGMPAQATPAALLGTDAVAAATARRRGRRRPAPVVGLAAAALLLAALVAPLALLASRGTFAPAEPRPAGATDAYVENIVVGDLDRCVTRFHTPAPPWTCPRLRVLEPAQLRGDPMAGATVRYDRHGNFTVSGHFVVVAVVPPDVAHVFGIDAAAFQAQAHWNGDAVVVTRIDRVAGGPSVPRPPGVTDAAVLGMAQRFLRQCAGHVGPQFSMSQGCPEDLVGDNPFAACDLMLPINQDAIAAWKQDSDPTAGAAVRYDPSSGMFRVTGQYALDETVIDPARCDTSAHKQGAYQLALVWERDADGTSAPAYLGFSWG